MTRPWPVLRTRNSIGERSSSSRSSSTGSSSRIESVARPSENLRTEISEVAPILPAASSNPTSCEKSPSGPISTSTSPSKSFDAERAARPCVAVGSVPFDSAGPASSPIGDLLHPALDLDRVAPAPSSGSWSPGRAPARGSPRGASTPSPARAGCGRGDRWPSAAPRATTAISRSRPRNIPERQRISLSSCTDSRITGSDGRIDFCAPVAEESPPEATHGRQARGAVGRYFVASASGSNACSHPGVTLRRGRRGARAPRRRGPARAAARPPRAARAGSGREPRG